MTPTSQKAKTNRKGSWSQKISASRGKQWLKNVAAGRRDASLNPSNIRLLRLRQGLDQESLARLVGISESTFGAIERGRRPVKKEVAQAIANTLKTVLPKVFTQKAKKFIAVIQKQRI